MPALSRTDRPSPLWVVAALSCLRHWELSVVLSSPALTQVEIIRSFTAKQPDELSLQVADVVLIYQRVSDGE